MIKNSTPRARELTSHRVNGLNEALRVFVLDAPGHGGACHEYVILSPMDDHDEACEVHRPRAEREWEHFTLENKNIGGGESAGVSLKISDDGKVAQVVRYDTSTIDVEVSCEFFDVTSISFQNGPIKENGVNGISQETLIAVLIDRLEGFQSGDFKCHDNQVALDSLQNARLWLHKRTMDRVARGVEGTTKA